MGRGPVRIPRTYDAPLLVRGSSIRDFNSTHYSLLVCSDHARLRETFFNFILSLGSVELDSGLAIVVVCDGDFVSTDGLNKSLVIARGNVRLEGGARRSVVLAGGDVHVGKVAA
ncbi:MAG: hypothetical protein ACRC33_02190, partial [Gemmataceae bacterium]